MPKLSFSDFLAKHQPAKAPKSRFLKNLIAHENWEAVRALASYPGSLEKLGTTAEAIQDFGEALVEQGRLRELMAFEAKDPTQTRRLLLRIHERRPETYGTNTPPRLLDHLPAADLFDLPVSSPLRQMAIRDGCAQLAMGDYTHWDTLKNQPAVMAELFFESPSARPLYRMCQHQASGVKPPRDYRDFAVMAATTLSPTGLGVLGSGALNSSGHINQRPGCGVLNTLDDCVAYDNPKWLANLMKYVPASYALEYPVEKHPSNAGQISGFGLINSLIQHRALDCLVAVQKKDPTSIFRPRMFKSPFTSEPCLRYPLDDFMEPMVTQSWLNHYQRGKGTNLYAELISHIKAWGTALLPPAQHADFLQQMDRWVPNGLSHFLFGERVHETALWIAQALALEPAVCPSAVIHVAKNVSQRMTAEHTSRHGSPLGFSR